MVKRIADLTVIVPLYNKEQYIKQCIDSILGQTNENIKVIVIDDGSTDNGGHICDEIANMDNRVTVIHQENKGPIQARLTGINITKTKYVTFVDADDFILPNAYEYAIEAMCKDTDLICFEITRYYNEQYTKRECYDIRPGYYNKIKLEKEVFPKLIWNFEKNIPGVECSQCVSIVKNKLLKHQYKSLTYNFYYGEDIAVTYPLYLNINSFCYIPISYYMHRQRNGVVPPYIENDNFFDGVVKLYQYLKKTFGDNKYKKIFFKQIDYFFMYSIQLKKINYADYSYRRDFLFPFQSVPKDKNIVLYGAGEVGKVFYKQLCKISYCKNILWVDKNFKQINDVRVKAIENIFLYKYDYLVIAIENHSVCENIKKWLISNNVAADIIICGKE